MTTTISVIICAHTLDRYNELLQAVEASRAQTMPPHEIIVAIDHNPDLYARLHDRWSGSPPVRVIENQQTRGLSGARNTAITYATGQILAFLDDDATPELDWLATLTTPYADPTVSGVGGRIIPNWATGRPRWFPEEFDWVVGCTYRGTPTRQAPVRNLIGANMSFRREVFETAGDFTSGMGRIGALPVGCEETELCIRYRQLRPGHEFIYTPQAVVHHLVPGKRANWRYFWSRCFHEGRSKAMVAQLVGAADGLSTERSYTLRTLPVGVLRGLADLFRGDLASPARSFAIVSGLVITGVGYLNGRLSKVAAQPAPAPQTEESHVG